MERKPCIFPAGTKPRNGREERNIPIAVNLVDLIGTVSAHEQKIRRSGHARGKGVRGKVEMDWRLKEFLRALTALQVSDRFLF